MIGSNCLIVLSYPGVEGDLIHDCHIRQTQAPVAEREEMRSIQLFELRQRV
jgi:hypothetical protein